MSRTPLGIETEGEKIARIEAACSKLYGPMSPDELDTEIARQRIASVEYDHRARNSIDGDQYCEERAHHRIALRIAREIRSVKSGRGDNTRRRKRRPGFCAD